VTAQSISTTNHIDVVIQNKRTRALIDTGSHYNCLNADFAKRSHITISPFVSSLPKLSSANGTPLSVIGSAIVSVSIAGYSCSVDFIVIDGLHHSVIFGLDASMALLSTFQLLLYL